MSAKVKRFRIRTNLSKVWGRNQSLGQFVWSGLVWSGNKIEVVNLEYKGSG